jgi:hypothetical protein
LLSEIGQLALALQLQRERIRRLSAAVVAQDFDPQIFRGLIPTECVLLAQLGDPLIFERIDLRLSGGALAYLIAIGAAASVGVFRLLDELLALGVRLRDRLAEAVAGDLRSQRGDRGTE